MHNIADNLTTCEVLVGNPSLFFFCMSLFSQPHAGYFRLLVATALVVNLPKRAANKIPSVYS